MNLSPLPIQKFFDNNGRPLVGGLLFTYEAGTSTKVATYSNESGTLNTNPVVLDFRGECRVWLDPSLTYKFVLSPSGDTDPPTKPIWTVDLIASGLRIADLTQQVIGNILYPPQPSEIIHSAEIAQSWYPPGHVYRYGVNSSPGASDMSNAFITAGLVWPTPYAPGDVMLITAGITLDDFQTWTLDGTQIEITGISLVVFTMPAESEGCAIKGIWTVTGDNNASGSLSGSAAGVRVIDSSHWRVEGLTAIQIKGWGLIVQPGSSSSTRGEHGQVIAFQAYGCTTGFETQPDTGAEYVAVDSPNIARCDVGLRTAAGNTNVVGGSITDCRTNVEVVAGSNHAHGIFSGVNINHATDFIVRCALVVNGQSFDGCHFYGAPAGAGAIWCEKSKGIVFDGGHMDCALYNYKDSTSGINIIRNMYCPGSYGLTRLAGTNNGHDELLIMDCYGPGVIANGDAVDANGDNMNDPRMMFVAAKRAIGSTQSLSGLTTLIWNTQTSDRRAVYDNTTGVFTMPPAGTAGNGISMLPRFIEINGQFIFGGTSVVATNSYVELQVDTGGGYTAVAVFLGSAYGPATLLKVPVHAYLNLAAGALIRFQASIDATTPVHGNASWESQIDMRSLSA